MSRPSEEINRQEVQRPHVGVCICTYRRPILLRRLLDEVNQQETGGLFSFSVVVCDNDQAKSAEAVIADIRPRYSVPVKYCAESRQNIALARNKVVENATG